MIKYIPVLLFFLLPFEHADRDRSVTFLVVADTHYGLDQWADNEALNKAAIDRMNAIPGTSYPPDAGGGYVDLPRGVLVAGDLTDTGEKSNWYGYWFFGHRDGFINDYALDGQGRIDYQVYEGYGNHDIHSPATGEVLSGIKERNTQRRDLTGLSVNGLHYSWDWNQVHFVNLNIYPGGPGDAEDSLTFLIQDLASHVGTSQRPVVIYHHYGLDPSGQSWWTQAERQAYYAVIEDYNVLGIFNGHNHNTSHRIWKGIDTYNVGRAKDQTFLVVNITANKMVVVERDHDDWGKVWVKKWKKKAVPLPAR